MNKGKEGLMLTEIGLEHNEGVPVLDRALKHQLLKQLEPEVLARIKKGFDLFKGTVDMSQFIVIMIDVLFQHSNWRKYSRQILTFVELFLLIDLPHIHRIRFEDFTNYLIDREEGHSYHEDCQLIPSSELNELQLQTERVFKLQGSAFVGLLTNGKRNVQILQTKTYRRTDHLTCGGPLINNIIFLLESGVYCLSSNDKYLSFYENVDHTLVRRFSVPDNINFLIATAAGTPLHRLICGSTNGHLYEFSLSRVLSKMNKKSKQAQNEQQKRIREYPPEKQYKYFILNRPMQAQSQMTCMDVMQGLDILVTGANDSRVRLYEMREQGLHLSKQLDGHYKGIKGVAVSVHHKLVVSCSFDFDVLVWNAYLEHPVARLEGHEAPLINVECPHSHQIILSLDAKAVLKVWSSDNYQLLQNVVIFQNFPANTSINFIYKDETDLAMIWTKRVRFYQYVVSYDPRLTDDQDLTAIKYSSKNLEVYIASRRSLKVWSVVKGVQTKHYRDIVAADISIIQLDDRQRCCFLGTLEGQIISIDLFSGLLINKYSSHGAEVSVLVYNNLHKLLISGGWDSRLKIHNDTQHLQRIQARENVMRNINNVSEKDLSGGCFSLAQLCIATHCKTNVVKLWDFEKGFLQTQFAIPNQISAVLFIDPLPLLVIVDVKGTIYIFSTKYLLKNPFNLLTQWKNMYSIQKSSQITFISSKYEAEKEQKNARCELILGDQFGYIRIVDISSFLLEQNICPVTADMIGNKNPYRIQDYNYVGSSDNSSNMHDFSHHESKNIVPPSTIRQKLQIKAHADRVTYVALVKQSSEVLILSAGSDFLVKIWNEKGEARGVMRQGAKENRYWMYEVNKEWANKETIEYMKVRGLLSGAFENYLLRKRMEVVPFTEDNPFEEINNDDIYKDLREVEGYLQKTGKKSSNRLY